MVHFSLPLIALLTLATSVTAAPATSATTFTFAQWIEDIIANPDGDHLTPEEAVAARIAAVSAANPLNVRAVSCREEQASWRRANANDAAGCLNELANKGRQGQFCSVPDGTNNIQLCRVHNAVVAGSKASVFGAQGANCNDIARTGGRIFDSCFRADGTIKGSEICITNGNLQVNILGPS